MKNIVLFLLMFLSFTQANATQDEQGETFSTLQNRLKTSSLRDASWDKIDEYIKAPSENRKKIADYAAENIMLDLMEKHNILGLFFNFKNRVDQGASAHEALEKIEKAEDLNFTQSLLLRGFYQLNLMLRYEYPPKDIGKVCAFLLSCEHYKNQDSLVELAKHEYPLIAKAGLWSLNNLSQAEQAGFWDHLKQKGPLSGQEKLSFMQPLVLADADSNFSFKTFLYALTQKAVLLGLNAQDLKAHGGVFASPLLAFVHDEGHALELARSNEEAENLAQFACYVLDMIKVNKFSKKDKNKAVTAAFYLLHESPIKDCHVDKSGGIHPMNLFQGVKKGFAYNLMKKNLSSEFVKAFFSDLQGKKETIEEAVEEQIKDIKWLKGEMENYLKKINANELDVR